MQRRPHLQWLLMVNCWHWSGCLRSIASGSQCIGAARGSSCTSRGGGGSACDRPLRPPASAPPISGSGSAGAGDMGDAIGAEFGSLLSMNWAAWPGGGERTGHPSAAHHCIPPAEPIASHENSRHGPHPDFHGCPDAGGGQHAGSCCCCDLQVRLQARAAPKSGELGY